MNLNPENPNTRIPDNLKIVFFGTPRFAQIVLEKLIDTPFKPKLVITAPDTKAGRGQKIEASPVKKTAAVNKIQNIQPKNLLDPNFKFEISLSTRNSLKASNFKLDSAILVAYGKIIPKEILAVPKYGFINVHPSLLPKYRGPSPIQSAILTGEKKTGVSIIRLDEIVDHGPILAKKELIISESDTHASLIEKMGKMSADLLVKTLPEYLEGKLKPKAQNHKKATWTQKITKSKGMIDVSSPPDPQTLDRMIRAYHPWPGTWCQLNVNGRQLTVKFLPNPDYPTSQLPNYSSNYLIQLEGKSPLTISQLKNGYPQIAKKLAKLFPKITK